MHKKVVPHESTIKQVFSRGTTLQTKLEIKFLMFMKILILGKFDEPRGGGQDSGRSSKLQIYFHPTK